MLAIALASSSASSLAMALIELVHRALLTVTLFLASPSLFPNANVLPVRGQYLLGLGIGDVTG